MGMGRGVADSGKYCEGTSLDDGKGRDEWLPAVSALGAAFLGVGGVASFQSLLG